MSISQEKIKSEIRSLNSKERQYNGQKGQMMVDNNYTYN